MISQTEQKKNVLVCAYCVDKNDVGEAWMAYKWIMSLSDFANLWVVTTGSRLHSKCGLEDRKNIELITLRPRIKFTWWDHFDRIAHPGYTEFFHRARIASKRLAANRRFDLCHHLSPRSIRYPSPLVGIDAPLIVGPFHGGLKAPDVLKEIEGSEPWYMKLRALDALRFRFDPLLRGHYDKAKRLIISAPYVADILLPEHRGKCVVIPPPPTATIDLNAVETARFARNDDVFRMLYVGRIIPSKGLALIIHAMAKLSYKNLHLTVYGKGSYALEYRRMAENLELADQITWEGFVPNRKLVHAYCQADAFVFPSLKEPTGIALTEAMTAGLPILCANVGGPAFLVGEDCGIKIPVVSKEQMVSDLAKAINRLMENPAERTLMGRNAQERAITEFSWGAVIKKMIRVYNEVTTAN